MCIQACNILLFYLLHEKVYIFYIYTSGFGNFILIIMEVKQLEQWFPQDKTRNIIGSTIVS